MFTKFIFTKTMCLEQLPYFKLINIPPLSRSMSTGLIPPGMLLSVKENINIRNMSKEDLKLAINWAKREGWNPGRYEVEPLYAADPKGYYLLELNGQPIASLAAVRHSECFAFLGLYIVLPEFRGKGYGKMLWDFAMGNIKSCSSIGLNGVINQVESYKKSGFYSHSINTRWCGKPITIYNDTKKLKDEIFLTTHFSLKKLIDYDRSIFSTPREAFITQWIKMPESHVIAALNTNGNLCGYGVVSRAVDGYKIAPLFADGQPVAEKIFSYLSHQVGKNKIIQLDTSEPLDTFKDSSLATKLGLKYKFNTMRMYKGPPPCMEYRKSFGLAALEIG